jgi:hypothetical protein
VRDKSHGVKLYHHPLVGDMTLAYETVIFPGDDDQMMCVYTVEPDSPSEAALQLLANWTGTTGAAGPPFSLRERIPQGETHP